MSPLPPPAIRRAAWSDFVNRALDAGNARGWTVNRILAETGVGKSTLYRWIRGDWEKDPEAAKVRDFCDGLGINPDLAFAILWPSRNARVSAPEPLVPIDPDVERVLRMLADPAVTAEEKYHIRETIRGLTSRRPGSGRRRAV